MPFPEVLDGPWAEEGPPFAVAPAAAAPVLPTAEPGAAPDVPEAETGFLEAADEGVVLGSVPTEPVEEPVTVDALAPADVPAEAVAVADELLQPDADAEAHGWVAEAVVDTLDSDVWLFGVAPSAPQPMAARAQTIAAIAGKRLFMENLFIFYLLSASLFTSIRTNPLWLTFSWEMV